MKKDPKSPTATKEEKAAAEKALAASKEFKPRAAKGARNTPEKQRLRD